MAPVAAQTGTSSVRTARTPTGDPGVLTGLHSCGLPSLRPPAGAEAPEYSNKAVLRLGRDEEADEREQTLLPIGVNTDEHPDLGWE